MASLMIVDDDPDVLNLLTNVLAAAGHRVEAVANALEALTIIYSRPPPDLLITDVLMPGMTGFDLARRVRRDRPAVRLLYISGFFETAEVINDPAARYGKVLHKPIAPNQLRMAVAEALAAAGLKGDDSASA